MSPSETDRDASAVSTLERIIALARRGHARYSERAVALRRWLREQIASDEDRKGTPGQFHLRRWLTARHLVQRQQAYRGAGGQEASVARMARQRAADLARRDASRSD